jgi:Glyoxalase-like domain
MPNGGSTVRLRQAVLVAGELAPVASALKTALGLQEPFNDPSVAWFGLTNAVFALGDCFLEIVSPARPDTAAGRYLARHGGDGGYMVIFDLEDLEAARARAQQLGVRVAWQIDLPDISATHLHPADTHGAIVSLDRSQPYGTWRWGGPHWTGQVGRGAPGRLAGITVAVADPATVATRWAQVLGVPLRDAQQPALKLDGAEIHFAEATDERGEGLVEIAVELPDEVRDGRETIELGGVRLRLPARADRSAPDRSATWIPRRELREGRAT